MLGIITFILFKIPLVGKLIRKITTWYVKTKWWKLILDILVKLRKGFIIFNALIAIYALVDITGFSTDNIIGGFYGLGVKYIEMITSIFTRLFNWLVDLFDYKVIPNIPSKEFVPSPEYYNYNYTFKELEPTTDWNTWFRYGCYAIISMGLLWLLLYQLDVHPTDYFKPKDPKGKAPEGSNLFNTGKNIGFYGILSGALKSGVNSVQKVFTEYLNPFSEYNNSNRLRNKGSFVVAQLLAEDPDQRYYPYTPHNKYDSWFDYTKKLFYESKSDRASRLMDLKDTFLKGTSSDIEIPPAKSVRFDIPQESSKPGILDKVMTDIASVITNKNNASQSAPISPPLSPEDLVKAGADVWKDQSSRNPSPIIFSSDIDQTITNNIPTLKELTNKIENIMKSGTLFEYLAEYSYGTHSNNDVISSKLGPKLEGSRPSFLENGVMLPLHANDPLNFLNSESVFNDQWFNATEDNNMKVKDMVYAVRDYFAGELFTGTPVSSTTNSPQQGTSNLINVDNSNDNT